MNKNAEAPRAPRAAAGAASKRAPMSERDAARVARFALRTLLEMELQRAVTLNVAPTQAIQCAQGYLCMRLEEDERRSINTAYARLVRRLLDGNDFLFELPGPREEDVDG